MPRSFAAPFAALFAFTVAAPAAAQQATQDWAAIDALTQTVAAAMGRDATPIDRRIKLQRCPDQVAIAAIDGQALAVRCDSLGWRLRVAMTGDAVPAVAVAAASKVTPAAPAIRRGDAVRVSLETDSFSISYGAVASEDGRVGETIALRDPDSRRTLSAIVTGPGRARIAD